MGRSAGWICRAGICGAWIGLAALPSLAQAGKTLRGKVETRNGGVVGVTVVVTLQSEEGGPVMTAPVDSGGNFVFSGLGVDVYNLTVKAQDFQTYQQPMDLSDTIRTEYTVQVFLSPLATRRPGSGAQPALTDMAAPKNARKEFEKAKRAWKAKRLKDEKSHLEKAVEAYPCYARAQTLLADVERDEKDLRSAEASYAKAIQCDGTFLNSFHGLADLYLMENRPEKSEAVLLEAQRVAPNDWMGRNQLGAAHYAMGEYSKAAEDFAAAESLHPDMPAPFHIELANVYLKTREYGKALAQIDIYLRLSPNGGYSANARKMAAELRQRGVTEIATPASTPGP